MSDIGQLLGPHGPSGGSNSEDHGPDQPESEILASGDHDLPDDESDEPTAAPLQHRTRNGGHYRQRAAKRERAKQAAAILAVEEALDEAIGAEAAAQAEQA